MPSSERKSYHISYFGELSLTNCMDWCVALTLAVFFAFTFHQLGGARPDTLVIACVLLGIAIFFHTLTLVIARPSEPIRINAAGFFFFPYLIYLGLHLAFLSPYPWKAEMEFLHLAMGVTIFWLACQNFRFRYQTALMLFAITFVAAVAVLIAIMQYFHSPEWLPKQFSPVLEEPYIRKVSLPEEYLGQASGFLGQPPAFAALTLAVGFGLLVAGCSCRFSGIARVIYTYLGIMMMAGVFLSQTRSGIMLMAVGLYLLPVIVRASWRYRVVSWILLTLALGGVTFIFGGFEDLPNLRKPVLWRSAWEQFLENPIAGHGAGGFAYQFEGDRPPGFNRETPYADNGYLELLADQGVLGFLLFCGPVFAILVLCFREWARQPDRVTMDVLDEHKRRPLRAPTRKVLLGAYGLGMSMFCLHLFAENHLRHPGLLFLFFLTLGFCTKYLPLRSIKIPRTFASGGAVLVTGLALSVALPLWMSPRFVAHAHAQEGDRALQDLLSDPQAFQEDQAYYQSLLETLTEAVERAPDHAPAWSHLSRATAEQVNLKPASGPHFGETAESHANRAIEIAPLDANAWINLAYALELQGRIPAANEAFRKATEIAPNNAGIWRRYARFLNAHTELRADALPAIERAIELDPGNEDAERIRRRILIP